MPQSPVIVIPGITASNLEDYYPIPPESIWSAVVDKKYDRIALHPDNPRYELQEPAWVKGTSIFGLVYGDLVDALRHELASDQGKVAPVFPYGYDWRQDCTLTADQLSIFLQEVVERTRLMPQYRGHDFKIDLVGHSMGGMIIADYLSRYGSSGLIGKVVSLGTPFNGAIDAVLKIISGQGQLTGENPRDREREASRTIPSLYQLLPSFPKAVISSGGAPTNLFDVGTWQGSVLQSLARYCTLHQTEIAAENLLNQYLTAAKDVHDRIASLDLNACLEKGADDWLAIVGIGDETQVNIANKPADGGFRFEIQDDKNEWPKNRETEKTGDGTVPYLGALPPFMNKEKIICVCPEDLSRWEVKDTILVKTMGLHPFLPVINLVQRLTVKFLKESFGGKVWAWRPPGVEMANWDTPNWLTEKK